jgi:hypothetical protein
MASEDRGLISGMGDREVRLTLCCAAPKRQGNSGSAQTTNNFTRAIIFFDDILIAPVAQSVYIVISVFQANKWVKTENDNSAVYEPQLWRPFS